MVNSGHSLAHRMIAPVFIRIYRPTVEYDIMLITPFAMIEYLQVLIED